MNNTPDAWLLRNEGYAVARFGAFENDMHMRAHREIHDLTCPGVAPNSPAFFGMLRR